MDDWEPVFAALLLFLPGICSIACSSYIFFVFVTVNDACTPFMAISVGRCLAHFLNGLIYGIYFPIRILLNIWGFNWLSPWIDELVAVCWILLAPTELLLALNRIAAINLISRYNTIFSMRNTMFMMGISWMLALASYFYHMGCFINFNVLTFEADYPLGGCLERDRMISTFIVFPCMAISLFLSAVAFGQIMVRTKKMGSMRNRRQWLRFAQAPAQILVWTIATLFWITEAKTLIDSNLWRLACMTLPQITAHGLESLIILLFYHAYNRSTE